MIFYVKTRLLVCAALTLAIVASLPSCGSAGGDGTALKHFRKGKLAYGRRKLALAVKEFERAVEADGGFLAARIMKGKAEFYQGKFVPAANTFRAAHEKFPGNAACHYWLGRVLLQTPKERVSAREHLLKAVSYNDNYFNAHYYLGVSYEREGKIKEALIEYRRATLIKKDFDRIHRRLAGLYRRAGFPDRAASEMKKVEANK